ncbi:MAG: 3-deoxy-8-phosphooctulonate synthase [Candidatus Midichloria mitochondrii]|uniref:2-dehydro-3-deoxyphosphooctonate aldolase n=1 Tax=Midichloria mitochondrii (strain IricVA) TaxID=696127 RepID=F7XWC1_MIDMI|nr:3-deoxy-8-phosphooctulonate synthase [Candidatus Midichloria mitochondrii]AEI88970.1 2-dehydro-3-deoxyphosphooctonate aldolase [Candidatus Midichloria mitochondrii IricVA]MDJ1255985.1 3-deoxy-8-phosphooctulonate synthase [Candidatus Midichloria mitochondrii]MDJ1287935.1 3-deoxy-8-phosphooctulonate synthase [Candidatus Midichloria mitochondrii]MDJ1298514.1 3-deoxy-8-phosphooctulonate synthase [Candidatus Midichloria mitochondrii]MDJ1312665.1 3-deoxy-8-phosphooctulonate synthase [Candidatus M
MHKIIEINEVRIANNNLPFILIAGPCQIESKEHALETAHTIAEITKKLGINCIYKSSFDKANRTSIEGRRGIGLEKALEIFEEIKKQIECPVLTDVHLPEQCEIVSDYVDVLQIPAFLCRQTDLLIAAGHTGKAVNIKKGQFLAPQNMKSAADKVASTGNQNILLTERGVSFGYNNLVNDMRALPIMAKTGYPVIFDATHSVQQPGGLGLSSGGQREFIKPLARAAVAAGVAGLFIETHPNPDSAPSDGPCMLPLSELEELLTELIEFDQIAKKYPINL